MLAAAVCSGCVSTTSTMTETGRSSRFTLGRPGPLRTVVFQGTDGPSEVTVVRQAECPVWAVESRHQELRVVQEPSGFTWTLAGGTTALALYAASEEAPEGVVLLSVLGAGIMTAAYLQWWEFVAPTRDEVARHRLDPIVCRSERVAGLRVSAGPAGERQTDARGVARFFGPVALDSIFVEGARPDAVLVVDGSGPPAPGGSLPGGAGSRPAGSSVPAVRDPPPTGSSAVPPGSAP